jgi:hypothetical protein
LDGNGASVGSGADASNGHEAPVNGFVNGNASTLFTEERLRSALSSRDEGGTPLPFDAYTSASFGGRATSNASTETRQSRSQTLSSFSPFSPDPNLYLMDHRRMEPAPFSRNDLLPHPSRSYAPGFGPSLRDPNLKGNVGDGSGNANNGQGSSGKVSPTIAPPGSASRYTSYLESNLSAFPASRAGRPEAAISRPTSGHQKHHGYDRLEHDLIQDLNGTLASLDLDHQGLGQGQGVWKSREKGLEGGGLPFKVGRSQMSTPSP